MYSKSLKAGIGQLRAFLEFHLESGSFEANHAHGTHQVPLDAPLLLVACSGGRDSLALAQLASVVCPMMGIRCGAVLIDHRLQPVTAHVVEQASEQCRVLGLDPVVTRAVSVSPSGAGVEAAARDARYQAICEVARNSGVAGVLLAHTLDDQAETVLLGLMRNNNLSAIAGMSDDIVLGKARFLRPLLGLTRKQTTQICVDAHLTWWDDPTNGLMNGGSTNGPDIEPLNGVSSDFGVSDYQGYPLRSQVRQRVLPVLKEIAGDSVLEHLAGIGDAARDSEEILDGLAERIIGESVVFDSAGHILARIDVEGLDSSTQVFVSHAFSPQPFSERSRDAMVSRVIAKVLGHLGIEHSQTQVSAITQLVTRWHGQGTRQLPSGFSASRHGNVIEICHDEMHE